MAITYTRNEIVLGDQQGRKQTVLTIPAQATPDKPGIFVLQAVADSTGVRTNYYYWDDGTGLRRGSAIPTNMDGEGTSVTSGADTTLSNLTGTVVANKSLSPGGTTNTLDLGAALTAWKRVYLGTSVIFVGSKNTTLGFTAPAADRAITFGDPGGSDSVAYLAADQDFTTKTYDGLTIAASANTFKLTRGTASLDVAEGKVVDINQNVTIGTGAFVTSAACTLDQDLQKSASPTWVGLTLSGAVAGITTLGTTGAITNGTIALTAGAISGVTTIAATGAVTCQGIVNTVAVIDSTVGIQIGADDVNLTFGENDATDSKIYFNGTSLMFDDSVAGGPYSLTELATGTNLNPTVLGDLTVVDGKFNWADGTAEAAGVWTFTGTTTTDIAISSAVSTGKCLSITANDLTSGSMIYLASSLAGMIGKYIQIFDGAADDFSVSLNGATVIAGSAGGTAALTVSLGDIVASSGKLLVTAAADLTSKFTRNVETLTSAVVEIEQDHATGGVALLVDSHATGNLDAAQITYSGTYSGLNITNSVVGGLALTAVTASGATAKSIYINGTTTNGWIGAASTGMLHLASNGALAATTSSLLYSTYTGSIGAGASMVGTCGYFVDAGAASGTTYAVGIASTANNGLGVTNTAIGKSGVIVTGPSGQTAAMVSLVGTVTSGWIGAGTTGMLHLASNGALANATSSLLYSTYTGAIAAIDCVGTCAQFVDAGTASSHVTDVFAVGISSATNSGLKIATTSATAYDLLVVGPTAQTAKMVYLDGTATNGWGGAANTGMLHLAYNGKNLATTASALLIAVGTSQPTDASLGYALRIADTSIVTTTAGAAYAAYLSTATNSGLQIVTGGVSSKNITLSGVQAQVVPLLTVDGTTGEGWDGAANTGMVHATLTAATVSTTASALYVGCTAAINDSRGHCLRINDTSDVAGTMGYPVSITSSDATMGGVIITTNAAGKALAITAGITDIDGPVQLGSVLALDSVETVTNDGSASVATAVTLTVTADPGDVIALANGTYAGQIKTIVMKTLTDPGDTSVVTPADGGKGFTTATLSAAGHSVTLQYIDSKWTIIGYFGATIA